MKLVKKLMESIREYKTASILTPVYVTVGSYHGSADPICYGESDRQRH